MLLTDVEKFNALEGATDYFVPYEWDAGHVAYRMTEAYRVLRSMPGRVGPQVFGSTWPAMLTEFADLADDEAWTRRLKEAFGGEEERWSADEIAMADEALGWPMRHLADQPLRSDAIQIWAYSRATGRSLTRLLRDRAKKAAVAAELATRHENEKRSEQRAHIARVVASWVNERLYEHPERAAALKENARIRMERACRGHMPMRYRPSDVEPDQILSRTSLDRHLHAGLDLLARRLAEAEVPVR